MVVVWVKVGDCFLGYRAIACPCLCQLVESSSCVFTVIGYGGYVHKVMEFRWCFGLVESVGRLWRLLMIFEEVVGVKVGRLRCRDRQ